MYSRGKMKRATKSNQNSLTDKFEELLKTMSKIRDEYSADVKRLSNSNNMDKIGAEHCHRLKESFKEIVSFNKQLSTQQLSTKEQKEIVEMIRNKYHPSMPTMIPFYLLNIRDLCKFDSSSLLDWKCLFIFRHKINVNSIECLGPDVRQGIRLENRNALDSFESDLFKNALNHLDKNNNKESSLDLALYLFQIGIIKEENCETVYKILNKIKIPKSKKFNEKQKPLITQKFNLDIENEDKLKEGSESDSDDDSESEDEDDSENQEATDQEILGDEEDDILGENKGKQDENAIPEEDKDLVDTFATAIFRKVPEKLPMNEQLTEEEIKKEKHIQDLLEKMSKCILHIIILKSDTMLVKSNDPEAAQNKFVYFFNHKELSKPIFKSLFKIVGKIGNSEDITNEGLRNCINKIFMSYLSVRNDPIVLSMYSTSIQPYDYSTKKVVEGSEQEIFMQEIDNLKTIIEDILFGKLNNFDNMTDKEISTIKDSIEDIEDYLDGDVQKFTRVIGITSELSNLVLMLIQICLCYNYTGFIKPLCNILLKILAGQPSAHAVLFGEQGRYAMTLLFEVELSQTIITLTQLFENDSSMLFRNKQLWFSLFNNLTQNINSMVVEIDKRETSPPRKYEILCQIYLINQFFYKVLKHNNDNEEERALTSRLQIFYFNICKVFVFPRIKQMIEDENKDKLLFKGYKPTLIYEDDDSIQNSILQIGKEVTDSRKFAKKLQFLEYDILYSFLKIFNESVQVWKFIPTENENYFDFISREYQDEEIMNEDGDGDSKQESKNNMNSRVDFTLQSMKYKYLFFTEFCKLYTNLNLFEYISDEEIKTKNQNLIPDISKHSKYFSYILVFAKKISLKKDENLMEAQRQFIIQGVLRTALKLFSGVKLITSAGKDGEKYQKTGIRQIIHNFKNEIEEMMRDIGFDRNEVHEYMQILNKVIPESKTKQNNNNDYESHQYYDQKDIDKIITMIKKIFVKVEQPDLGNQFNRECHKMLQTEFQEENQFGTQAYEKMIFQGSLGIEEFILRVYRKQGKNDRDATNDNLQFLKAQSLKSFPYEDSNYQSYILKKTENLREKETEFNRFLKEGDETADGELFYKQFFEWMLANFGRARKEQEYLKSTESFKAGKIENQQYLELNIEMLQDTGLLAWINIIDNLMIHYPHSREIFFTEYLQTDLEFYKKQEKAEQNGIQDFSFLHSQEFLGDTDSEFKLNSNQESAKYFLISLFKSAIFFQKYIRSELFDRCFLMNMSYYVSICNTIKGFAEDNYHPLKEYVGYLPVDETKGKREREYFLEVFFDGLYINPYFNQSKTKYSRTDRPDLNWYNIVTLETLAEYFNGPCRRNQNRYINDIIPLINFIKKKNENINSMFYEVQEGIIDFILVLIEGDNPSKCSLIEDKIDPKYIYENIVNLVKLVYTKKFRIKSKDKVIKLSREIERIYMQNQSFGKHPGILAALGMFFIMKSVSNHSKRYTTFLEDKTEKMAIKFTEEGLEITSSLNQRIKQKKQKSKKKDETKEINYGEKTKESIESNQERQKIDDQNLIFFHFINLISCSVEIVCEDKTTVLVHFPIEPQCKFISKTTMNQFQQNCNRDDTASKVLDLMTHLPEFMTEMNHSIEKYRVYKWLYSLSSEDTFGMAMKITYLIGLLVNALCILGYGYQDPPQPPSDEENPPIPTNGNWRILIEYQYLLYFLYLILSFISVIFLGVWFIFEYPQALKMAKKRIQRETKEIIDDSWLFFLKKYVWYSVCLQFVPCTFGFHLLFAACSFLNPIFHTIHLFLVLYLSTTARYVIKSITEHVTQLLVTLVLAIFATYSYAMLNAMYYRDQFHPNDSDGRDLCGTMISCLIYVTDFGLRNGGGIAESHLAWDFNKGNLGFYLKIAFNLSFFIFINLISLNIIFGIIIDTFAELRDEQQERGKNINNVRYGYCEYMFYLRLRKKGLRKIGNFLQISFKK